MNPFLDFLSASQHSKSAKDNGQPEQEDGHNTEEKDGKACGVPHLVIPRGEIN